MKSLDKGTCISVSLKFNLIQTEIWGARMGGPRWGWEETWEDGRWLIYWSMLHKFFEAGAFKHSVVYFQKLPFQMSSKNSQTTGDFRRIHPREPSLGQGISDLPCCCSLLWWLSSVSRNKGWIPRTEQPSAISTPPDVPTPGLAGFSVDSSSPCQQQEWVGWSHSSLVPEQPEGLSV